MPYRLLRKARTAAFCCTPEDAEYLEMLQAVVDGYSLGGRTLTGEVV